MYYRALRLSFLLNYVPPEPADKSITIIIYLKGRFLETLINKGIFNNLIKV